MFWQRQTYAVRLNNGDTILRPRKDPSLRGGQLISYCGDGHIYSIQYAASKNEAAGGLVEGDEE